MYQIKPSTIGCSSRLIEENLMRDALVYRTIPPDKPVQAR